MRHLTRRGLLHGAVLLAVTGCVGRPAGDSPETPETTDAMTATSAAESTAAPTTALPTAETSTVTATAGSTPTDEPESRTAAGDLDLREANVVGVAVSGSTGRVTVDVTLYHDDDGEDGYANWWQVETLAGDRLGRRTLFHAHSTAPFTRSETISIPAETGYVVVRGHDQTHGYGGQAMVVNVATGETEAVRQGPEPRDFSAFDPHV